MHELIISCSQQSHITSMLLTITTAPRGQFNPIFLGGGSILLMNPARSSEDTIRLYYSFCCILVCWQEVILSSYSIAIFCIVISLFWTFFFDYELLYLVRYRIKKNQQSSNNIILPISRIKYSPDRLSIISIIARDRNLCNHFYHYQPG